MSADLFAEFSQTKQSPPTSRQPVAGDEDDSWGDFEVADPVGFPSATQPLHPVIAAEKAKPAPSHGSRPIVATGAVQNRLLDVETSFAPNQIAQPQPRPRHEEISSVIRKTRRFADPNVLFDASDFDLESQTDSDNNGFDLAEDFGDYESADQSHSKENSARDSKSLPVPSVDLLGLDEPAPRAQMENSEAQLPSSQSLDLATGNWPLDCTSMLEENLGSRLVAKSTSSTDSGRNARGDNKSFPGPKTPSAEDRVHTIEDEDEKWEAWDNDGTQHAKKEEDGLSIDMTQSTDSWNWGATQPSMDSGTSSSKNDPLPTNVPPPSIILSIFPGLLNSTASEIKKIAARDASSQKQMLSEPWRVDFLRGYVLLGVTAARVIAGRRHRWHRDKLLAQKMSISAAGSKGMKLNGIDRMQATREEREVAEVVTLWKEHVGQLRAVVGAANRGSEAKVKVPTLEAKMQVETAKLVPTAVRACLICGLKREERVVGVDLEVEDSFGEWWVEHWGHRACKEFWLEHEQQLRQR